MTNCLERDEIMDRRKRKTQQAIKEACLTLLETKNFETMNVSDITAEADISRGTFYLHYIDKYDMLEQFESTIKENISLIFLENLKGVNDIISLIKTRYKTIIELFTYVKEEHMLFKIVFKINGGIHIQSYLTELLKNAFDRIPSLANNQEAAPIKYDSQLFIPILGSIIFSVFQQWIDTVETISPEDLAKTILSILINGPAKTFGFISGEVIDVDEFIRAWT